MHPLAGIATNGVFHQALGLGGLEPEFGASLGRRPARQVGRATKQETCGVSRGIHLLWRGQATVRDHIPRGPVVQTLVVGSLRFRLDSIWIHQGIIWLAWNQLGYGGHFMDTRPLGGFKRLMLQLKREKLS